METVELLEASNGHSPLRMGGTAAPIRVLIVDDHPAVCEAIALALSRETDILLCGTAHTALDALDLVRHTNPDVAIIDLSLGDAYGLSLVSDLHESHPYLQVVIYSMSKESIYAERTIRTGALGYVPKTDPPSSVVDAIRTVHSGRVYLNRRVALNLLGQIIKGGPAEDGSPLQRLTNQEMAVVHLLGIGHSVDKIARLLNLTSKTVVAYQRRAKEKLGYETTGELLHYAMQWSRS